MEDFLHFVSSRYSIRSYDSEKQIDHEKLLRVLEAARFAPSAANRQPWKILVVTAVTVLEKLHLAYPAPWFAKANTVLIVKGDISQAWTRNRDGYNSINSDLAILMTHILLAAHAEGLSTCWIEAFDKEMLCEALSLKETEVVCAMTPIGYHPEGEKLIRPKSRKELDEIVEWM